MTIEIRRRPELEALIQEWMQSGAFQDVEDRTHAGAQGLFSAREEGPWSEGRGTSRYWRRTCGSDADFAIQRDKPRSPKRTRTYPRRCVLMAWLLDTNVLSELRRPIPNARVVDFIAGCPLDQAFCQRRHPRRDSIWH